MIRIIVLLFLLLVFQENLQAQNKVIEEMFICNERLKEKGYGLLTSLAGRYSVYNYSGGESIQQPTVIGIWDCSLGESIESNFYCSISSDLDFCLPFQVSTSSTDTTLTITHYGMLPYGRDWQLISLPVFEQVLFYSEQNIFRVDERCLLKPDSIPADKSKEVLEEYRELRNQGIDKLYSSMDGVDSMDWLVLKLFVCSFGGDEACENLFFNLQDDFPGSMDGVVGDTYNRWLGIYQLHQGRPLSVY